MPSTASRRFAATAATAVLSLGALAAPAHASAGQPAVHGCPAGDACSYPTKAAYTTSKPSGRYNPSTIDYDVAILQLSSAVTLDPPAGNVYVDNTDPEYTSEGNYVLSVDLLGLSVCLYVPDPNDEQAPDTVETDPASAPVHEIAFGPTAASVDSLIVVGINDCD